MIELTEYLFCLTLPFSNKTWFLSSTATGDDPRLKPFTLALALLVWRGQIFHFPVMRGQHFHLPGGHGGAGTSSTHNLRVSRSGCGHFDRHATS